MPAGLQVFNDAGIIQIDDMYQNYFAVRSGTIRTDANRLADLWIDYNGPIIVATSSPYGSCCAVQDRQGTNWIYKVGSGVPNDTVKWYAFTKLNNVPFKGGLQIIRDDGLVTFDSNYRPLVISYFFDLPAPLLPDYSGHATDSLPKEDEVARPQDIYIPLKQGHTYTAFPILFTGAVSVAYKKKYKTGIKLQYDHYCYMPQTWTGGINFKPIMEDQNAPRNPLIPAYYRPKGMTLFPNRAQQYWVIDLG